MNCFALCGMMRPDLQQLYLFSQQSRYHRGAGEGGWFHESTAKKTVFFPRVKHILSTKYALCRQDLLLLQVLFFLLQVSPASAMYNLGRRSSPS